MTTHLITVVAPKRGTAEPVYRWRCSCGRLSKHGYGFAGLAEMAGRRHAEWKTAQEPKP